MIFFRSVLKSSGAEYTPLATFGSADKRYFRPNTRR